MKTIERKVDIIGAELTKLTKAVSSMGIKIESKIQKGFKETKEEIEELARITAEEFEKTASKTDLGEFKEELKNEVEFFRGDLGIMIDKYVGDFHGRYDELAMRTKDLEEAGRATG